MSGIDEPLLLTHAERIHANVFLSAIYRDVYARLLAEIPVEQYPRLLEIGSGAGFLRQAAPHAITSDCVAGPGIDRVVDACRLDQTFEAGSLDAIAAFDVFHHLPDAEGFLRGAEFALRPGGRVVMIEPWFTPLGQWFYRVLHHEPSVLDPNDWTLRGEGRLGGANSRLPTSVFGDGRLRMARVAPALVVAKCVPFHKWLYLLSGGLRLNTRIPEAIGQALLEVDRATSALDALAGIFALIVVERRASSASAGSTDSSPSCYEPERIRP
ncbi:MAG: methyltransferase domain-containing protein [Polyangiaceae bacterium]|nr:methyltransferase domain-containing protein [Polyangiaceae bacterium]